MKLTPFALLPFLLVGPAVGQIQWNTADTTFPAEPNIQGLAVADLNGDSFEDLVYVQDTPGAVFVSLGNGDGTFGSTQNLGPLPGANTLALGHLDGDGILDLVVGHGASVTLFRGRAQGNFATGKRYSVAACVSNLQLDDMNGDGFDELLIADICNPQVVLGDCQGAIQKPLWTVLSLPHKGRNLDVGDLNGDGHQDIVASVSFNDFGYGSLFLGEPGLSFAPPTSLFSSFGGSVHWVELEDFSGDGLLDLMTIESDIAAIDPVLWIGNGDGTFNPNSPWESFETSYGPIVIGDFNGDGVTDMTTRTGQSQSLRFAGMGPEGMSGSKLDQYSGSMGGVAAGDFDQDGLDDLAVMGRTTGFLTIQLSRPNIGATSFGKVFVAPNPPGAHYLALHLGASYSGFSYLVLGSASGGFPGIQLAGLELWINPDSYTDFLLTHPNTLIKDSWGTLNPIGATNLILNPGSLYIDPALSGLILTHSFLVLDPLTLAPVWASFPLVLKIVG